jgi:hypothetical protein
MLLLDFIATQFFDSRSSKVKREDVVRLVKSINGVLDTFKRVADELESNRTRPIAKIPLKVDDTFN